jgi:hypothetical protein
MDKFACTFHLISLYADVSYLQYQTHVTSFRLYIVTLGTTNILLQH